MDIELGIQNVARTVTFSTEQSADESTRPSPTPWRTARPSI